MATEEIEISELEFTEELASDNLVPVESSTDTKATSLQAIKNWLSSFFVGKTGNEIINGDKTFVTSLRVAGANATFYVRSTQMQQGVNPSVNLATYPFYVTDKNGNLLGYASFVQDIRGGVVLSLNVRNQSGNSTGTLRIAYDSNGNLYTGAPTPPASDNSTQIATTNFVDVFFNTARKITSKCVPNYSAGVSVDNGYIASTDGVVYLYPSGTTSGMVKVNGAQIGLSQANNQDTSTITIILSKNDVLTWDGVQQAIFYPFKGV